MRALVSPDCITCSGTHDSVDPAVVIAGTRQAALHFPHGTGARHASLVTGSIVRIVSVTVRIIFVTVRIVSVSVRVIPVRIIPVEEGIIKEWIAEEDEFIEAAIAEPIAIPPKVSGESGTEARPGPSETRRHSAGCRPTADATAASRSSTAKPAPGGTTMRPGYGNRGAQSHCCNAAYEQNRFCIHNKLMFLIN
jgi:hypothetical protein